VDGIGMNGAADADKGLCCFLTAVVKDAAIDLSREAAPLGEGAGS
jgi:hypothetical protein